MIIKQKAVCIVIVLIGVITCSNYASINVSANSLDTQTNYEQEIDKLYDNFEETVQMSKITEKLKSINRQHNVSIDLEFKDLYKLLLNGNVDQVLQMVVDKMLSSITQEAFLQRNNIIELFCVIILASIFRNYSSIFHFSFIGEQGFYTTYLIIALLLIQSYSFSYKIAEDLIYYVSDITTCLLPVFCTAIMICSGSKTAQMTNVSIVSMMSLIERVLFCIVLPGIRIYFFISVLNPVNQKDRFSKLASLIRQGIQTLIKIMIEGIMGVNFIKSILTPLYDNTKYNTFRKGLLLFPGGKALEGLSSVFIAAAILIKNCVGIGLMLFMVLFISVPMIKLIVLCVVYKCLIAVLQPVSDNRILAGLNGSMDSISMLLQASMASIVLVILTIGILLVSTNIRLAIV